MRQLPGTSLPLAGMNALRYITFMPNSPLKNVGPFLTPRLEDQLKQAAEIRTLLCTMDIDIETAETMYYLKLFMVRYFDFSCVRAYKLTGGRDTYEETLTIDVHLVVPNLQTGNNDIFRMPVPAQYGQYCVHTKIKGFSLESPHVDEHDVLTIPYIATTKKLDAHPIWYAFTQGKVPTYLDAVNLLEQLKSNVSVAS
jgi:hypothetical protein